MIDANDTAGMIYHPTISLVIGSIGKSGREITMPV